MGQTAKKALAYGAGLIALYLAISYSTGFVRDVNGSTSGGVSLIKALQGR